MIKFFWYCYFGLFMALQSLKKIKLSYLKKIDSKKADRYAYEVVQGISRHIIKKSKTKVEVYGAEDIPKEACVFVGNHQAIFDAFVIMPYIENITGFIAKKEIEKIPLVSLWLEEIHSVYIDRDNAKEGMRAIIEGAENVKKGYSMAIFPEGTRSLSSTMGEFKKGSLKLAIKAGAPIVPFTVDGAYRVLEVGNKVRGNTIKIMFHKPIYIDKLTKEEQKDLTERVQSIVEDGLKQLTNTLEK